ncbi:MAG: hypothetical protein IPF41_00015 [Flavobacteriales bacterium]|nr:hypothetical protein [Flavobacteriales bacterium]
MTRIRRCCLLFCLFGAPVVLHAQPDVDSLWTVYRNPKGQASGTPSRPAPTTFDNNAIQQRPDTFAQARECSMNVLAEQVGDRTLIASAVMNRGVQFTLLADLDRADSCYARADSLNGPDGDRLASLQITEIRASSLSNPHRVNRRRPWTRRKKPWRWPKHSGMNSCSAC